MTIAAKLLASTLGFVGGGGITSVALWQAGYIGGGHQRRRFAFS